MASPPTGSDVLVSVRTDLFELTLKGAASHPAFPGVTIREKEALLRIRCRAMEPFEARISAEHDTAALTRTPYGTSAEYRVTPLFFEQQNYELIIEPLAAGHEITFRHENYHIRRQVTPVGNSGLLSGIINFRNEIGMSDLIVSADGISDYLKLTIEVFPSKISYKDDYKAIAADVTAEVYSLAFDFLKKTYDSFDISTSRQSSEVEFFAIIRRIWGSFISAADVILRSPHHELRQEHEVLPFYKAKRFDGRSLRWAEGHPQFLVRDGKRIRAEKMLAVKKYVTYDTRENRLTKFMLERTAARLVRFKAQYCGLGRETDAEVIRAIDGMVSGIRRRCESGLMREVDPAPENTGMSLVFGMAPGYRELFRCYLMLQHSLSVTGDVFNLSLKDLAVLYEYWCFIKLNRLLKDKYRLVSQDIIRVSGGGLFLTLVKGQGSRVKYLDPETGETFTLSYNPVKGDLPTGAQRPDNILRLEKKDAKTAYEYVFDAKYRVNPALPGTEYYHSVYTRPGPETGDINTMHRYRDAIVYQNGASPYERTMFRAYVLFPYHNEEEYRQHRFYRSIGQVNIGGLPFLPSATGLVTQMLDELISDSPESAFERATLSAGIEEKLAKVDWSRRDVLVGTLSSREQLAVCLAHSFYHIPAELAGKHLPVRYVAVCQTINLFGNEAGIVYYGEVTNYQIVPRREITEIPRDSDELYCRFEISEWKRLPRKIRPKEIGGVVLYTNLFLLEHSAYVSDLAVRSGEEYRFLSELRRRADDAALFSGKDQQNGFTFGDAAILFEGGEILALRDGKVADHVPEEDFLRRPNAVFRQIMSAIRSK